MTATGHPAWLDAALERTEHGQSCVLVTVAQTRGSTPREVGAKMLVWSDEIAGTIGGGHLEFKAIATARAMLDDADAPVARIGRFSLGPELAQCCGGGVALLFERLAGCAASWLKTWAEMESAGTECAAVTKIGDEPDAKIFVDLASAPWASPPTLPSPSRGEGVPRGMGVPPPLRGRVGWGVLQSENFCFAAIAERAKALAAGRGRCALVELRDACYLIETIRPALHHLYLFGAGHVGKAVVRALQGLPFQITWIDSRAGVFPDDLPPHVLTVQSDAPVSEVDKAPVGALFLVMTHSHPLDLEICARVLQRNDVAYLGLIGSETKRARFAGRLRAIGIPPQALARLTCPIGVPGIAGKEPAVIAASVAAQLLIVAGRRQEAAAPSAARVGS
jgi:xanthine dehydrogenase accessory factor